MGTMVGLQPQTVSKWVSICLSTQSAGRITPTAQSHHGSYPHRRRQEGGISEKRLSLMCQSNKKKKTTKKPRKPAPLLLLTLSSDKRRALHSTGHRTGNGQPSLRRGSTDPQAAHALRPTLGAPLPTTCTLLSVPCTPHSAPQSPCPA